MLINTWIKTVQLVGRICKAKLKSNLKSNGETAKIKTKSSTLPVAENRNNTWSKFVFVFVLVCLPCLLSVVFVAADLTVSIELMFCDLSDCWVSFWTRCCVKYLFSSVALDCLSFLFVFVILSLQFCFCLIVTTLY